MARFRRYDLHAPANSPVHVSRAVVSQVTNGDGAFRVEVRHGDGFESSYEGVDRLQIGVGDRVTQGTEIGKISAQGGAWTGLHFEIRHRGRSIDPTPLWKEN